MRFLKEIIARKTAPPEDGFYASMEMEDPEFSGEEAFADSEDFADEADYDEAEYDEAEYDEAEDDEAEDGAEAFAGLDESEPLMFGQPEEETAGANGAVALSEPDEPTAEAAGEGDEEVAKIWEMFDDDDDDTAAAPQEETLSDAAVSPQELARQAMKSMIVPPPAAEPKAEAARAPAPTPSTKPAVPTPVEKPRAQVLTPPDSQPVKRAGRAKTRMLGFHNSEPGVANVFERADARKASSFDRFPVGWLVLIEGPGRGASFTLQYGVSSIGRGDDQAIKLDFGDNSISRESHASIAYDDDLNTFFIGHGGKSNLVRLNGRPVLATEELASEDLIRIGETTLRFVGFCSPEFAWDLTDDAEIAHARAG